jgi:lysophospholipase L1-like esterase
MSLTTDRDVDAFRVPGTMAAMFGGTRRWFALLAVALVVGVAPGTAHAVGEPATLSVLVLGDSYSSGNGAGSYTGTPSCRRSSSNYARQFEQLVESAPGGSPTTIDTIACSGAVSADITRPSGGRPAQVDAARSTHDLVLLTIGGNDAGFSGIVASCLLAFTRDAAGCDAALTKAEGMVADGTLATRIRGALTAVRAHTGPLTRIVLLGYPYIEGDAGYTVPWTSGTAAPVEAGRRVRALTDAADRVDSDVVAALDAGQGTANDLFVSTKQAFAGHELFASRLNPDRWFVAPFTDAGLGDLDIWYHPNQAGQAAEARLLFDDRRVPKADVRS